MLSIVIVLSVAVGIVSGLLISRSSTQAQILELVKARSMPDDKVAATLLMLEKSLLDSISVDSLREEIMPLIIEKLDPHSSYISAKEMQGVNESLEGEFDGVGIVFNMATDTIIVLNVVPSGPSAQAGIMTRDRVVKINDTLVAGQKMNQKNVVKMLRGTRGTTVKMSIERAGVKDLLDIEVTRDKIPINSIEASLVLQDSIGYIKLSQFARTTYVEFIAAINKIYKAGARSLILDLRGNSGGFMDQAMQITNEFLPEGKVMVYTENRNGTRNEQLTKQNGQLQNLPVAILIDEGSASSSEIVAGALQDHDKGVIVGRRSFGKGLIQRQIRFEDGSAIRLTTARYLTPTGRSIQKPYLMGDKSQYELDIVNRLMHEELFTKDSIAFNDSLKYVTPKGRVVYGGGGIMPDIFVPLSREILPRYFVEVIRKNVLYRYTMDYSDKNRDAIAAVETTQQLDSLLKADVTLFEDFVKYSRTKGVKATKAQITEAKSRVEIMLKAYIGRNTKLSDEGYYINQYLLDDTIMSAIKELESPTMPR
ncbi:MAG: S41 family peptidase [Rikenellaceae bacterium]